MPTIKQLPAATSVNATDVIPVSQNGTTRSLAVGNLLSSTQSAIALTPGKLVGRISSTSGGPEVVGVGSGLAITGGNLAATGDDHVRLPVAASLSAGDEVVVNSGGAAKRMPAEAFRGLFSAGNGVSIDSTGTISAQSGGAAATATAAGAVKPGTGLAVTADGTLNVQFGAGGAVSFNDPRITVSEPLGLGDLRRYGWVGDGRDETNVFSAALTAVSPGGGHIVVPDSAAGTTLGEVTIDRPVTIRGEGGPAGQTLLRPATTTTTMFTVRAPFVTIENLSFGPANPAIWKQSAGSYIRIVPGAARFRGVRLTFSEFHEGITVAGTIPTVELVSIFGFLYSTGLSQSAALLHFQGGLDVRVNGLTANGPGTGTTDVMAGIWVENIGDATITNADVIAMGTDLLVNPGDGQVVTSLWVCDSFLDTAYRGADWMPTGSGQIVRSRMSNVWCSSQTTEGIRIGPRVDGLDIDMPHVFLNGGPGIAISGGTNIRVRGGQIAQNSGDGVSVAAGLSDWSVEGCTIGKTGGLAGNAGFGVRVAAGASDRYRVSGNSTVENGLGGFSDGGTGTHKSCWNNMGDANDYFAYRDAGTGLLRFVGRQGGVSGYSFATDDGQERFRVDATGASVNGSRVIHAGLIGAGLSWNGSTLSASSQGTGYATTSSAGVVKPDGTTISVAADGTLSVSGSSAGGFVGQVPASAMALMVVGGTPYTMTQAQVQAWVGTFVAATSATINGTPSNATLGAAVSGIGCSLVPAAAGAYASITVGLTEQLPRTAFAGTTLPALTPASSGNATISIYAGAIGGSPLATTGSINVQSSGVTGAAFASVPSAGVAGQPLPAGGMISFSPTGSSGYVVLHDGSSEQGARIATGSGALPTLTPANQGSYTVKAYGAATGGSELATSPVITIASSSASWVVAMSSYAGSSGGSEPPPSTAAFGSGSAAIVNFRPYVYRSADGALPDSVSVCATRSATTAPTSGSGASQYGSGAFEFQALDLFSNQGAFPGLFTTYNRNVGIYGKGSPQTGVYYWWFQVTKNGSSTWIQAFTTTMST